MSYIVTTDKHPRGTIDIARFARDLALIYGATVKADANPMAADTHKTITGLADNLELDLYADNWKKRVSVKLIAPDVPWGERKPATESITVNPERAISKIAADIVRRCIEAGEGAIKEQRSHAVEQQKMRGNLQLHAEALRLAIPGMSVKVHNDSLSAVLYFNNCASGDVYIDATMSPSGSVSIHRIGSMNADKFRKLMAVLTETPAKADAQ